MYGRIGTYIDFWTSQRKSINILDISWTHDNMSVNIELKQYERIHKIIQEHPKLNNLAGDFGNQGGLDNHARFEGQ